MYSRGHCGSFSSERRILRLQTLFPGWRLSPQRGGHGADPVGRGRGSGQDAPAGRGVPASVKPAESLGCVCTHPNWSPPENDTHFPSHLWEQLAEGQSVGVHLAVR